MSVASSLLGKSLALLAAAVVGGAASGPAAELPRPSNGHSDQERVSPLTQVKVRTEACTRDAAKIRLETRLAMSLDDFEEVLAGLDESGVDAQALRARYTAVFRDEILKAAVTSETRAHTASEVEGDVASTVAKALNAAEQAFRRQTGVTAVVVMEGLEVSVDDPDCGGPIFVA